MTKILFNLFACAFLLGVVHASELSKKLAQVNVSSVQAEVGIGVLDLSSGESWFLNGEQRFPMQSVFKLPVGIAILKMVDDGALSLDQSVTVGPERYALGWSPLRDELKGRTGQYTVRQLLERSVADSDNTAVDVLIGLAGGAGKVDASLRNMGIRKVRVDRTERELQTESQGVEGFLPEQADPEQYEALLAQVPEEKKKAAIKKFLSDPRDTATPEGMTHLLSQLYQNKLLSPSSTQLLLKTLRDTPHGQRRLKAGLPPGWSLAHKTGTGAEVLGVSAGTNDAGLACAPDGKCFALAVFIAGSKAPLKDREALMRDVAAAVTK
jgi:beta-lactamase class A